MNTIQAGLYLSNQQFYNQHYKIHFNILFLKKENVEEGVHKGKSAEDPWMSMMQPWPSPYSISNDANRPPLLPLPEARFVPLRLISVPRC